MTVPVLTIDGPSGSGKGTIAALIAEKLGWALLDSGAGASAADKAEAAIRIALQQTWDDELVLLYGLAAGADPERQLVVAESWVKEKPNDPKLLLTLGRICLMNQAWPKAREYFETSLRLQRSPEVYGELGRLCVAMGDSERGGEYLSHATVPLPALPLPFIPKQKTN